MPFSMVGTYLWQTSHTHFPFAVNLRTTLDVRSLPAYSLGDAARYLHIPPSTVRCWVLGQSYPDAKGVARWLKPVIVPADTKHTILSFINLTELHVLSLTRREYKVPMPVVRNTIEFLKREMGVKRPLAEIDLFTDRVDLFVEQLGEYMSASGSRQIQPREIVQSYLKRIERDKHGTPLKLYPLVRSLKESPQQERIIEIDPSVAFGRPVLHHTGIRTAIIVDRWKAGEAMQAIAADYGQPMATIEEVIRCETERAA